MNSAVRSPELMAETARYSTCDTLIGMLILVSRIMMYLLMGCFLRFVTTPLLLLDLLLTAGLLWPSIIWTIFLDIVMVVTGLVRALTKTRYKWG